VSSAAFALPDRSLVLDRYRPLKPLGRGGSGSVRAARFFAWAGLYAGITGALALAVYGALRWAQ